MEEKGFLFPLPFKSTPFPVTSLTNRCVIQSRLDKQAFKLWRWRLLLSNEGLISIDIFRNGCYISGHNMTFC